MENDGGVDDEGRKKLELVRCNSDEGGWSFNDTDGDGKCNNGIWFDALVVDGVMYW